MDLDDFLSEPSSVKAPAVNRFKPKAKPRPQKKQSVVDKAAKEQHNDIMDKNSNAPKSSSFTNNETVGTKERLIGEGTVSDDHFTVGSSAAVEDVEGSAKEDEHLSAETFTELQYPENITAQSTTTPNFPVDAPNMNASNAQNAEEISGFPEISLDSPSPFRKCTQMPHDLSTPSTYPDSGDVWIEVDEEAVGFSCLDGEDMISGAATASGKRPVKYKPKPKPQSGRDKDAPKLSHENQNMNVNGSIYTEEPHTMSSPSTPNLDESFLMNSTTSQPDSTVYQDPNSFMAQNLPDECGKLGKSTASDGLNFSDKSLDGETGLSGFEPNEVEHESNGVQEHSCDQVTAEDRGESSLGNETLRKRIPRKCKKVASENDETAGKKSKKAKVSDQSTKKLPKKVPRAPRRKRCVNKALLKAPEDEIDFLKVPIRDLIILAEYNERQSKKNTEAVQPSLAKEGTDNNLQEDPPCENYNGEEYDAYGDSLGYDESEKSFDNPSTSAVIKDTGIYNYHSFMDKSKTTKVRWSKSDTELFYQGIQEFGSDFLMIQKFHFPTMTRNQIKLKYKKEERENPAVLYDALNSRAKDLSHFQILAQRVKTERRGVEENDVYDDDDDLTGQVDEEEGVDEGTPGTYATSKEEAVKPEESVADEVPETAQDDIFTNEDEIWLSYESQN